MQAAGAAFRRGACRALRPWRAALGVALAFSRSRHLEAHGLAQEWRALFVRQAENAIAGVHMHDARAMLRRLLSRHPSVVGQDDQIVTLDEVGSCSVDADLARAALAGN